MVVIVQELLTRPGFVHVRVAQWDSNIVAQNASMRSRMGFQIRRKKKKRVLLVPRIIDSELLNFEIRALKNRSPENLNPKLDLFRGKDVR